MKNWKDLFNEVTKNEGIPFMEGREKGTLPIGTPATINDWGYIKGDDGEYSVISLRETPKQFYFGGSIITKNLKAFEELAEENGVDLATVKNEGIQVIFNKEKSKNNREYMYMELV